MTDKEKIRSEIERLYRMVAGKVGMLGECDICRKLLSFIDSLQEEPIFKVGDTIQKKNNNSIRYSIINKTSEGYRALRGLSDTIVILFSEQDQWKLVEDPVSDDLEKVAYTYALKCQPLKTSYGETSPNPEVKDAVIYGAKWQKQQDKETIEIAEDHAMFAGMEKMREQMMKDAIDGEIFDIFYPDGDHFEISAKIPEDKFQDGDKVKIIIIKKE